MLCILSLILLYLLKYFWKILLIHLLIELLKKNKRVRMFHQEFLLGTCIVAIYIKKNIQCMKVDNNEIRIAPKKYAQIFQYIIFE